MKLHIAGTAALTFWYTLSCSAQTLKSMGDNSPVFATVQGNVAISYEIDQSHKSWISIIQPATSMKLNALQRHQDALLLTQNPTTVKIAGIEFLQWSDDTEKFMIIRFRNIGKLPAHRVEYGITNQKIAGRINKIQFLKILHQKTVPKNLRLYDGIESGEDIITPLISISDLRKYLNVPRDYCIVAPRVLDSSDTYPVLPFKPQTERPAIDMLLPIAYTYWSIFEQKYIINSPIAIVAVQRDSLVLPEPGASASYTRCID
ncbi:hypothetical protein ACO0LD_09135 [Undibacterium sp. Ji83W]|uniref:hypothetical protein n=1 Tax=Undibacterium sp. Ji83W TaxID=3413043 RepID=UPI003BF382BC